MSLESDDEFLLRMQRKRKQESVEHQASKRLRVDSNGNSVRKQDGFSFIDDEEDDDIDNGLSKCKNDGNDGNDGDDGNDGNDGDNTFDILLYELAKLEVSKDEMHSICPICNKKFEMKIFANHVYSCLDAMDAKELQEIEKQVLDDKEYAKRLAAQSGLSQDNVTQCPVCGKIMNFGDAANLHVNQCFEKEEKRNKEKHDKIDKHMDEMEDDDVMTGMSGMSGMTVNNNNNNNNNNNMDELDEMDENEKKSSMEPLALPPSMSSVSNAGEENGFNRNQLIACASALLSKPKDSQDYANMLEQFGKLGFNENNMKTVVEGAKMARKTDTMPSEIENGIEKEKESSDLTMKSMTSMISFDNRNVSSVSNVSNVSNIGNDNMSNDGYFGGSEHASDHNLSDASVNSDPTHRKMKKSKSVSLPCKRKNEVKRKSIDVMDANNANNANHGNHKNQSLDSEDEDEDDDI